MGNANSAGESRDDGARIPQYSFGSGGFGLRLVASAPFDLIDHLERSQMRIVTVPWLPDAATVWNTLRHRLVGAPTHAPRRETQFPDFGGRGRCYAWTAACRLLHLALGGDKRAAVNRHYRDSGT